MVHLQYCLACLMFNTNVEFFTLAENIFGSGNEVPRKINLRGQPKNAVPKISWSTLRLELLNADLKFKGCIHHSLLII